jgi:hypothetical protein
MTVKKYLNDYDCFNSLIFYFEIFIFIDPTLFHLLSFYFLEMMLTEVFDFSFYIHLHMIYNHLQTISFGWMILIKQLNFEDKFDLIFILYEYFLNSCSSIMFFPKNFVVFFFNLDTPNHFLILQDNFLSIVLLALQNCKLSIGISICTADSKINYFHSFSFQIPNLNLYIEKGFVSRINLFILVHPIIIHFKMFKIFKKSHLNYYYNWDNYSLEWPDYLMAVNNVFFNYEILLFDNICSINYY